MHLQYEWKPEEWREAQQLASAGPRRAPKPVMTYAMVGIMSMGCVGELVSAVRASNDTQFSGSLLPLLLFVAAVVAAAQIYARGAKRRRRVRPLPAMPRGSQQLMFSERGWQTAPGDAAVTGRARPWTEFREQRKGRRSLILLGGEGVYAALPLRVLSTTQGSYLHRLLIRKLHRTV